MISNNQVMKNVEMYNQVAIYSQKMKLFTEKRTEKNNDSEFKIVILRLTQSTNFHPMV